MSTDDFQLDDLLANLSSLKPEHMIGLPSADLEWTLAQFVLSLGQQLPVKLENSPSDLKYRNISRFGRRYLPFAVAGDFQNVGEYEVCTLALATACGILHSRLLDIIIDDPSITSPSISYAIPHVYFQFCHLLNLLFPVDSILWIEVERLTRLTSRAGIAEKQSHSNQANPYSWEEFQQISHDKMALAQINPFALALLNGTPELIPIFQECWKAISLAVIVNDDILDWQEDYNQGNYTYLLTQILLSSPINSEITAGRLPTLREVGVALFASDSVEKLYLRAWDVLQQAQDLASSQGCFGLANLVHETAEWIQERHSEVTVRKVLHLFRPSIETKSPNWEA